MESSTPKHYISDLSIFFNTIGDKAPNAVSVCDIDAFVEAQVAAGLSPTMVNRRLATLHTFFEYQEFDVPGRKGPNPVIWHRHGLKTRECLPRDASDKDVAGLFAVITDKRDQAMFGLMIGAGLRVGEVSNLRLNDLEAPVGSDQLARIRVLGKRRKERIVWCVPSLWAAVVDWLAVRPQINDDHLFLNWRGQPITVSGIQYCLKQYC